MGYLAVKDLESLSNEAGSDARGYSQRVMLSTDSFLNATRYMLSTLSVDHDPQHPTGFAVAIAYPVADTNGKISGRAWRGQ